jgi:hypothetical protein
MSRQVRELDSQEDQSGAARGRTSPQFPPVFVLRLTPLPGVDAIRALRAALKTLLRCHGLRCVSVRQDEGDAP